MNALYRHFNKAGDLLYVGVSISALNRLGQHATHSHWFESIAQVTIEHCSSRELVLTAERAAIQTERPLHNIHYKKAPNRTNKPLDKTASARTDLTARVVTFRPVYTLNDAALTLGMSIRAVRRLLSEKRLGYFTLPNKTGTRQIEYITGWQLIDWIESATTPMKLQDETT